MQIYLKIFGGNDGGRRDLQGALLRVPNYFTFGVRKKKFLGLELF
jgi:hypothetical protein